MTTRPCRTPTTLVPGPRALGWLALSSMLLACTTGMIGPEDDAALHDAAPTGDAAGDAGRDGSATDAATDASPVADAADVQARPDAGPPATSDPPPPSGLVAFTGGTSIALRWSFGTGTLATTHYNIVRDGAPLATVTPAGYDVEFPENRGCGYVDHAIAAGHSYGYQVQAVDSAGHTSTLSASLAVTAPTHVTPSPTFTIDATGGTDLQPWLANTLVPFLQIWFPKMVDMLVAGAYPMPTTIRIHFDPTTSYAWTLPGEIAINPTALRGDLAMIHMGVPGYSPLGALLHESVHAIQFGVAGGGNAPSWVNEGMADWSREFVLHDREPGFGRTEMYTGGYSPSSYLINYAGTFRDGAGFVRQLNVAQHMHAYSDNLFMTETGHTIAQLWTDITTQPHPLATAIRFYDIAGKCLEDGTDGVIRLETCHPIKSQRWRVTRNTNGTLRFATDDDTRGAACLSSDNFGRTDGTRLLGEYACDGNAWQQFRAQPDGALQQVDSSLCLDDPHGVATDGTVEQLYTCAGGTTQAVDLPAY